MSRVRPAASSWAQISRAVTGTPSAVAVLADEGPRGRSEQEDGERADDRDLLTEADGAPEQFDAQTLGGRVAAEEHLPDRIHAVQSEIQLLSQSQ